MIGIDIAKAKTFLEKGEIVALPTETIYGLAAHAFHPLALYKLFASKQRPLDKPFVLQTYSLKKVATLVKCIPPKALKLAQAFWPGPLTLVLEKGADIPDLLTAGKPTVGLRIPHHPLTLSLLKRLDFPLAVTSANLSGHTSALTPQQVYQELGSTIAYILDGGTSALGIRSTIIGMAYNKPVLLRPGYIPQETIERVIGKIAS